MDVLEVDLSHGSLGIGWFSAISESSCSRRVLIGGKGGHS